MLLGGIELFIPEGYGLVFFGLEIVCLLIFYFMLDGEPQDYMK